MIGQVREKEEQKGGRGEREGRGSFVAQ